MMFNIHKKLSLTFELILVLIIKVLLIYGISWAFFSAPISRTLTEAQFADVLFGSGKSYGR